VSISRHVESLGWPFGIITFPRESEGPRRVRRPWPSVAAPLLRDRHNSLRGRRCGLGRSIEAAEMPLLRGEYLYENRSEFLTPVICVRLQQ
jgi:hypothetical protein